MELIEHPFFEDIEPSQAQELAETTIIREFAPNELIFEEGSPSDSLCLLLKGSVTFCKKLHGDNFRIVSHAQSGSFFGEIGLFTGEARSLRAVAGERSRLAMIPRDRLVDFIRRTRGPIDHILQSIISHLHATTRHYVDDMLQQEKMAVVGAMVNTIIHDFKNPFCLISLGAQIIAQLHQDEKTQKLCQNIEEQIERMVDMAEELNLFSRGTQQLKLEETTLPVIFENFRQLNFPFFEKKNVTIELDIEDIELTVDSNKFLRVLQNLVGNAIDAFGENTGKIVIAAKQQGKSTLLLTVSDNGKGIPAEIRGRFFEPFVTFGKSKGTGLGAAIVKSIVEAHQGSITFETGTGEGTTFFIHLPLGGPTA